MHVFRSCSAPNENAKVGRAGVRTDMAPAGTAAAGKGKVPWRLTLRKKIDAGTPEF